MLGGQPFVEDIVMWWNFIGRSHRGDRRVPDRLGNPRPTISAYRQSRGEGDGGTAYADDHPQAATPKAPGRVNPVQALREIGFLLERSRADTYRVRAYRGAADAISKLSEDQRREHQEQRTWAKVSGVGTQDGDSDHAGDGRPGARIPAEASRGEAATCRGRAEHACARSRVISTVTRRGPTVVARSRR